MLEGRALARLTDLGWGNTLRTLFASPDAPASPALLAACVRVLADWNWDTRPVAVVSLPSRSRPLLIDSVARGLAGAGKLPYLGALDYLVPPAGGPGGNSAFRLAQVMGAFAVGPALATALAEVNGPVLLVDDLADSRWTLTVAARVLRQAGVAGVLPFVVGVRG
jgi:ATP-dependent DNA helicase RecQ